MDPWHRRSSSRVERLQLFIDPGACICEPACPVNAIFDEKDVPAKWAAYTEANAAYFKKPR